MRRISFFTWLILGFLLGLSSVEAEPLTFMGLKWEADPAFSLVEAEEVEYPYGHYFVLQGNVSGRKEASLSMQVTGPKTLNFAWMANGVGLEVDGLEVLRLGSLEDTINGWWYFSGVTVPAGKHNIRFRLPAKSLQATTDPWDCTLRLRAVRLDPEPGSVLGLKGLTVGYHSLLIAEILEEFPFITRGVQSWYYGPLRVVLPATGNGEGLFTVQSPLSPEIYTHRIHGLQNQLFNINVGENDLPMPTGLHWQLTKPVPLAESLGNQLRWELSSSGAWQGLAAGGAVSETASAAVSVPTLADPSPWLQTSWDGPAILSYAVRPQLQESRSSDEVLPESSYEELFEVLIDTEDGDARWDEATGASEWRHALHFISQPGPHQLRFVDKLVNPALATRGSTWLDQVHLQKLVPVSIAAAADSTNIIWTVGGEAAAGYRAETFASDGRDAVIFNKPDEALLDEYRLSAEVAGPGRLTFQAHEVEFFDYGSLWVDGIETPLHPVGDKVKNGWRKYEIVFEGAGLHSVQFGPQPWPVELTHVDPLRALDQVIYKPFGLIGLSPALGDARRAWVPNTDENAAQWIGNEARAPSTPRYVSARLLPGQFAELSSTLSGPGVLNFDLPTDAPFDLEIRLGESVDEEGARGVPTKITKSSNGWNTYEVPILIPGPVKLSLYAYAADVETIIRLSNVRFRSAQSTSRMNRTEHTRWRNAPDHPDWLVVKGVPGQLGWTLISPQSEIAESIVDEEPMEPQAIEDWVEISLEGPTSLEFLWQGSPYYDSNSQCLMDGHAVAFPGDAFYSNVHLEIPSGTHVIRWVTTRLTEPLVVLNLRLVPSRRPLAKVLGAGLTVDSCGMDADEDLAKWGIVKSLKGLPLLEPTLGAQNPWVEFNLTGPGMLTYAFDPEAPEGQLVELAVTTRGLTESYYDQEKIWHRSLDRDYRAGSIPILEAGPQRIRLEFGSRETLRSISSLHFLPRQTPLSAVLAAELPAPSTNENWIGIPEPEHSQTYDGIRLLNHQAAIVAVPNQDATMTTSVTGPAWVQFRWKLEGASERFAYSYYDSRTDGPLRLKLDGALMSYRADSLWRTVGFAVPAGVHQLAWEYHGASLYTFFNYDFNGIPTPWLDAVQITPMQSIPNLYGNSSVSHHPSPWLAVPGEHGAGPAAALTIVPASSAVGLSDTNILLVGRVPNGGEGRFWYKTSTASGPALRVAVNYEHVIIALPASLTWRLSPPLRFSSPLYFKILNDGLPENATLWLEGASPIAQPAAAVSSLLNPVPDLLEQGLAWQGSVGASSLLRAVHPKSRSAELRHLAPAAEAIPSYFNLPSSTEELRLWHRISTSPIEVEISETPFDWQPISQQYWQALPQTQRGPDWEIIEVDLPPRPLHRFLRVSEKHPAD